MSRSLRLLSSIAGAGLLAWGAALAGCTRNSRAERDYAAEVARHRAAKDAYFKGASSPLTPEQRADFHGLRYYPASLHWVASARLEQAAQSDTVQFPTSKGTFDPYLHVGTLRFELEGRPQSLALYRAADNGHWFLPFTDGTSGRSTYGAGRYLDLEVVPGQPVQLDFNHAYNPYCAYNADWICPLAPPGNRLGVAVQAGEKSFHDGS
jgi:uncharacterized protein